MLPDHLRIIKAVSDEAKGQSNYLFTSLVDLCGIFCLASQP